MPTWENFELIQWAYTNYFVYLVDLHQGKTFYNFKGWYIKTNIEKKVSVDYVVQIFWNLEIVN